MWKGVWNNAVRILSMGESDATSASAALLVILPPASSLSKRLPVLVLILFATCGDACCAPTTLERCKNAGCHAMPHRGIFGPAASRKMLISGREAFLLRLFCVGFQAEVPTGTKASRANVLFEGAQARRIRPFSARTIPKVDVQVQ